MTTVELRFLANRFHATQWGRHVNEAVPEWPPSPYRLLRALYDAWRRKHPAIPEQLVTSVLEALSEELPRFRLPAASASHTRSYLSSNSEDPNDKSLIFDAFVAMDPRGACYLTWPSLDLTEEQRKLLNTLLGSLNFVGRSESWVAAKLFDGVLPVGNWCDPANVSDGDGDLAQVACTVPAGQYQGKQPWIEAIAYSTTDLIKERRSSPPALWMAPYVRSRNALVTHVGRAPQRASTPVQAIMLGLDSNVLPLITGTIEVAEQIRVKLMGIHKRTVGDPSKVSPRFSGKSPEGKPILDHSHAFILPLGNGKGRIDRVLVYTRDTSGFRPDEIEAILRLRTLWQADGRPDVCCVVTWKGSLNDSSQRPLKGVVTSKTPFVTVRHWRKGRGEIDDFLRDEIRRECRNHRLPEPLRVDPMRQDSGLLFQWIEFRRNRKDDPPRPGYGFRLEFGQPVPAPFTLGYGCHYGLGQFDGN